MIYVVRCAKSNKLLAVYCSVEDVQRDLPKLRQLYPYANPYAMNMNLFEFITKVRDNSEMLTQHL